MSAEEAVEVLVVTDRQLNKVTCSGSFTAEELCIFLCKKYSIPPLTRTLFGLRVKGTDYFLKDNCLVLSSKRVYELRIRFKVPRLSYLITLDENTFDYYFQQARNDVNENRIPEIKYPEHKKELLGLGITDMFRAILEEKLTLTDVERNYKKYIPKVILRRHGPFPKKYAHELLPRICVAHRAHDVNFVKTQYLQQLYLMAPNYLSEEYKDISLINGSDMIPVTVQVAPFHNQQPGIRMLNQLKQEWTHVSSIEELVYLTRSGDYCLEVSRSGTPMFFKFKSEDQLSSFISVCDGYYRLMEKWTFNLSKDDETPSLKQLHMMKCHGPVGGAFAYRKLVEKKDKKHGSYILRQCQDEYNVFFLDVCTQNNTVEIYPVKFKGDCYVFNNAEYPSVEKLVSAYKNVKGRIYLNECVPPTEYGDIDKSQLLLCGKPLKVGYRIDQAQLQEILRDNRSPRCLNIKHIPTINGTEKYGSGGITVTKKGMWRLDETKIAKTLVVAFKTLQDGKINEHLRDFIELANKWACVQSSSIVRLYGVTLSSPTAMVLEYIPYGPFDEYLRNNEDKIKSIHLKKVAVSLARALWDLSEAGIVHGHIRCRRLLLVLHDNDKIVVKLSGPSLNAYTDDDIHWIPVELFRNMSQAKRSVGGDIWAFGTTLWEIFSYGHSPAHTNPVNTAMSYAMGSRLLRPARCSGEVWSLVRKCWHADPHLRATPQAMMRDMNHLLHAEYIPVHPDYQIIHEYPDEPYVSIDHIEVATMSSNRFSSEQCDVGSNKSLISESTPSMNSTMSDQYNPYGQKSTNSLDNISGLESMLMLQNNDTGCTSTTVCMRGPYSRPDSPDEFGNANAPRLMECIYLDKMSYLVTFSRKIGTGNYGHVYAGWMERDSQETTRREVAIKKLRRRDSYSTLLEEFRNEMEIMKSLHHPHIVEIVGYSWDHASEVLIVMEYLEHGALSHYLKAHADRLTTDHLIKYALDIAMGMDLISAKNIVHRDLAARNVLVVNKHHVKISDFGLARVLPKEESTYRIKTERHLPIGWYAPESAVRPYHFSTESDVWSYGVTVWEIFTRASQEVPKFDETNPRERASCFPIPEGCPPEIFCHLMRNCWELDPNRRPKFIDLARHCKRLMTQF